MRIKIIIACLAMIGSYGIANSCDDVAVLSRDAQYMFFDAGDLSLVDVGNLWWLGIHTIDDILPGSTVSRIAIWSDSNQTRSENARIASTGPASILYIIIPKNRRLTTGDTVSNLKDLNDSVLWWGESHSINELYKFSPVTNYFSLSMLVDATEEKWSIQTDDASVGMGASCIGDHGNTIVFGPRKAFRISENKKLVELAPPKDPADQEFRFTKVRDGCIVLLVSTKDHEINRHDIQQSTVDLAVFDLNSNKVLASFRRGRFVKRTLYGDGRYILEQRLDATEDPAGGFHIQPTSNLQVLDVTRNAVISSVTLEHSGNLSRIYCAKTDQERAILYGEGTITLVSLPELSVLASYDVPFSRFSVF